jgi:phenylpropionate dioxygenase-like ring-hydroxylating dioxygenase large terminal subunit
MSQTVADATAVANDADSSAERYEAAPNLPAGLVRGLWTYWHPVPQSEEQAPNDAVGFTALGENLVAWRGVDGSPNVVRDRCRRRSIKLAIGRVFDGQLQCILHGLRLNGAGEGVMVPREENAARKRHWPRVAAYPTGGLGGYILGPSRRSTEISTALARKGNSRRVDEVR